MNVRQGEERSLGKSRLLNFWLYSSYTHELPIVCIHWMAVIHCVRAMHIMANLVIYNDELIPAVIFSICNMGTSDLPDMYTLESEGVHVRWATNTFTIVVSVS